MAETRFVGLAAEFVMPSIRNNAKDMAWLSEQNQKHDCFVVDIVGDNNAFEQLLREMDQRKISQRLIEQVKRGREMGLRWLMIGVEE